MEFSHQSASTFVMILGFILIMTLSVYCSIEQVMQTMKLYSLAKRTRYTEEQLFDALQRVEKTLQFNPTPRQGHLAHAAFVSKIVQTYPCTMAKSSKRYQAMHFQLKLNLTYAPLQLQSESGFLVLREVFQNRKTQANCPKPGRTYFQLSCSKCE